MIYLDMYKKVFKKNISDYQQAYPVFQYEKFTIEEKDSSLVVNFYYSIPPEFKFKTCVLFESIPPSWQSIPKTMIQNLIFHLGLIESFSYWKATCSPSILISAGTLNLEQLSWWKDLLLQGMGEFFFINNINFTANDFVTFSLSQEASTYEPFTHQLGDRSLLPIGGGRDSAFTAGVFQQANKEFNCMLLNPSAAARRIAQVVDCPFPIVVKRSLDPLLFKLNDAGFLNGHTPFSAYLAFLNATCLALYNYKNIIVANERSSDEGNTVFINTNINHQYSKSFDFEKKFDEYLQKYLVRNGRYFSFIRSLYELQVGRAFAQFPELFTIFRSCNRNQKNDSWCGNCPKCLSVFITFYPFVSNDDIKNIFHMNYFENENSLPIIKQLVGLDNYKPFECVATFQETIASLYLCVEKHNRSGDLLPPVLEYIKNNIITNASEAEVLATSILSLNDNHHRLPVEFQNLLNLTLKV
jgi:UDP-N-acetyl-alpha-D-muramoyl-L-alanyl-L-glutamate epimerase